MLFDLDISDLLKLEKFYRKAPKKFERAAKGTINSVAFGVRSESIDEIGRNMTVRDPRFVSGSMRVQKAQFEDQGSRVGKNSN